MAANASRSRGLFGRIGGFFGQRYKGAKEVVGGVGSGTKKYLYTKPGQFFTGGAVQNTVYNNKTNTNVLNKRKKLEVLAELEQHAPGITAEFTKRKKGTLREFVLALNSNGGTPRTIKINAANPSLNHYAELAFKNYQDRQRNSEQKKVNAQLARSALAAKAAANRNRLRENRIKRNRNGQLRSLVNSVLNDTKGNGTNQVTLSNANRTEILQLLGSGATNMYSAYTKNTGGAKSLKGFVAYLNTGRNKNQSVRNLSKMTDLEKAIINAIKNKKNRNNAKTASNANRLKQQQQMRNDRRARLMGIKPPPPSPPSSPPPSASVNKAVNVAVNAAGVANSAAKTAVRRAVQNPLLSHNAAIAVGAAEVANSAALATVREAKNGNEKAARNNARNAQAAAVVAQSANKPRPTGPGMGRPMQRQGPGPNNRRVPGKSGGGGTASGLFQALLGA